MKRRDRFLRWFLMAGAYLSAMLATVCVFVLRERRPPGWLELVLSIGAIVSGAGFFALLTAFLDEEWRVHRKKLDWLYGNAEWRRLGTDQVRWPRPPRQRRPRELDEPQDSAYWMKKLATAYAQLARFEELQAPATILEHTRRMIRERIAKLSPEDALTVMRSWKHLDSTYVKKGRKAPPAEGSN